MIIKKVILTTLLIFLSGNVISDSQHNGGDDFRQTAQSYLLKASQAKKSGHSEYANSYLRLAEIKLAAADLADQGRWSEIDWTEYHAINAKLYGHSEK